MTHFAGLVNVGVPPSGLTKKETIAWVNQRLKFILEPFDENLEICPYVYDSKKTIDAERKKCVEDQKDPTTYVGRNYPNNDFTNMSTKDFAEFWYGKGTDKRGNSLSTYNPRARWDWYEVGGRWDGRLITKDKKRVNLCQIKEIDFNAYKNESRDAAAKFYARFIEFVVKQNNGQTEEELLKEGITFIFGDVPKTKKENGEIEIIEEFEDFFKRAYKNGHFFFRTYIDEYGWHSETSYGWFGTSRGGENIDYIYAKKFEDYIKSLDENTYLAIVDFHF